MKPIALGLQIPSLRDACEPNARHSGETSASAWTLTVPYPIGKSTLQISGIHARLGPVKTSACKSNGTVKHVQQQHTKSVPSSLLPGDALTADIIVHAHIRGELSSAPRPYVVAVIPLRFDGTAAPVPSGPVISSSAKSMHAGASTLPSTPHDSRVVNAQARGAGRSPSPGVFASAFARIDLRTQMERVRLSFTVVPCSRTGDAGAATNRTVANSAAHANVGKRLREEAGKAADFESSAALPDCTIDVTVVGTVSPIA
ncbi:conserved hypothetical protein [Leishmania major strain Friedlin]|uniref:Uncharacterized protein n=1 Tax=Leishmania major TaxID=5664 RepID=Q4QIN0_LEIMA|nr:conserved hypothetical protein [Leishmania major strain Friedlin]CAG9568999.1 hypothetical_protein_-_conserved [Leishmania major strain Friedlin]CAJ07023.1 conserved hypothetical protein [Leishmania major strain Friedlin]|eukprot:XP_001680968.1 conserved hypothetical protein [Leishmania major strain Friedlin]